MAARQPRPRAPLATRSCPSEQPRRSGPGNVACPSMGRPLAGTHRPPAPEEAAAADAGARWSCIRQWAAGSGQRAADIRQWTTDRRRVCVGVCVCTVCVRERDAPLAEPVLVAMAWPLTARLASCRGAPPLLLLDSGPARPARYPWWRLCHNLRACRCPQLAYLGAPRRPPRGSRRRGRCRWRGRRRGRCRRSQWQRARQRRGGREQLHRLHRW